MPDSPPSPTIEHFKSWLLRRAAQAVEVGEVSGDLLTELQAEFEAAREMLHNQGGGELTTKGVHGRIRSKDTIPPGHDPNPPRDKEH